MLFSFKYIVTEQHVNLTRGRGIHRPGIITSQCPYVLHYSLDNLDDYRQFFMIIIDIGGTRARANWALPQANGPV